MSNIVGRFIASCKPSIVPIFFRMASSDLSAPKVFGNVTYSTKWNALDGEHSFLEEVNGEDALSWVKGRNEHALENIGAPSLSPLFPKILSILDSNDKIPHCRKIGSLYYNFWQDSVNPRGLWRRTTYDSFCTTAPVWETVIDVDQLCADEKESWVWKGHTLYKPVEPSSEDEVTLVHLAPGGSDATVTREFNITTKAFVIGGFAVPEAKSRVSWVNRNTLLIGSNFDPKPDSSTSATSTEEATAASVPMVSSLTDSGYPRQVRLWKRGDDYMTGTTLLYEGDPTDVSVNGYVVS